MIVRPYCRIKGSSAELPATAVKTMANAGANSSSTGPPTITSQTRSMRTVPQVVLFGLIGGDWREQQVIPVLTELHVTYYNPVQPLGWTHQSGDVEAEYMAGCETVVMVFNRTSPGFAALAEVGWAAAGCLERNQHFILQIDLDFPLHLPPELTALPAGAQLEKALQGWTTRSRYLVYKHACQFKHPRMHIVEDVPAVVTELRKIYGSRE